MLTASDGRKYIAVPIIVAGEDLNLPADRLRELVRARAEVAAETALFLIVADCNPQGSES